LDLSIDASVPLSAAACARVKRQALDRGYRRLPSDPATLYWQKVGFQEQRDVWVNTETCVLKVSFVDF
jgi:hypothetical protein